MVKRFNQTVNTLDHIADLFVSNWGKLEPAGSNANGSWAFSTVAQRVLKQSLAVTTKRVFYEALVPLIYEQWVISPNYTGASDSRWGGQALVLPGRTYRSWGDGDHPYPDPPKTPPFALSPDGALHYGGVHGWDQPGATTPPAAKDQVWFEIRALKSKDDPMRIDPSDYYRGGNPTIRNDGGNPPAALVDPLFQRIDPSEASNPIKLGMDKTRFYGDFNGGWGWRRAIAS